MGNLFLLGAGFDKSLIDTAPLNNELLSKLICFSNGEESIKQLENKYATNNIEHIITRLDLDILEGNEDSKKLRANINDLIAKYFQQFRFNENVIKHNEWIEEFIKNIISNNDFIVSLNYSSLVDGLLDYFGVWTPRKGYTEFVDNWMTGIDDTFPKNPKGILLYKIHGSEHFGEIEFINSQETYIAPLISKDIFPKSSAHSEFGWGIGNSKQYIAPSYIKTPHVQIEYLMMDAIKQAGEANNFIIIGCGMRPEDNILWLMLTNFLKADYKSPKNKDKKLILVNPQADSVGDRIKNHFSNRAGFFDSKNFVVIPEGLKTGIIKLEKHLQPI